MHLRNRTECKRNRGDSLVSRTGALARERQCRDSTSYRVSKRFDTNYFGIDGTLVLSHVEWYAPVLSYEEESGMRLFSECYRYKRGSSHMWHNCVQTSQNSNVNNGWRWPAWSKTRQACGWVSTSYQVFPSFQATWLLAFFFPCLILMSRIRQVCKWTLFSQSDSRVGPRMLLQSLEEPLLGIWLQSDHKSIDFRCLLRAFFKCLSVSCCEQILPDITLGCGEVNTPSWGTREALMNHCGTKTSVFFFFGWKNLFIC